MAQSSKMFFLFRCPKTVENFATHCENGYYNTNIFHRVIHQFMIQTGDPEGVRNRFKFRYELRVFLGP